MPIDLPPQIYNSQGQVMIRYLASEPKNATKQIFALEPPPSKPHDFREPSTAEKIEVLSSKKFACSLGAVLSGPPHELTDSEKKSFDTPLTSDTKAHTQKLHDKMGLVREPVYDDQKYYRVGFNHNPDTSTGFVPALITFKAKPAQYKRYIKQIKECLANIEWNDKVTITP